MLPHFDSDWILDLDTGEVVHIGNLYPWHRSGAGADMWAAYVDGFTVDDTEQASFSLPESRPGVAVNVNLLIEMSHAGRVVELSVEDGSLVRRDVKSVTA